MASRISQPRERLFAARDEHNFNSELIEYLQVMANVRQLDPPLACMSSI